MRFFPFGRCGKNNNSEEEVGGEVTARIGKRVMEEEGDTRLKALQQSTDGTWGQTSGSGRPSDPSRSHYGLAGKPPKGLQLLGGPSKPSPIEDLRCRKLAIGLSGLGLVLGSNEVVLNKDGSLALKDSGWANEEETNKAFGSDDLVSSLGSSQPLLGDNAHFGVAHSPVKFGPCKWRSSYSEFTNFWVKDGLRK